MRRTVARAAAAGVAGCSAIVGKSYLDFKAMAADHTVEERLPLTAEAQRSRVVRLPKLLSDEEIEKVHRLQREHRHELGTAGRTSDNQAAAFRTGAWETSYLSTGGCFGREAPELRQKLIAALTAVSEAQGWRWLRESSHKVNVRCVEYHVVEPGGSLNFPNHYDAGSLVTIDVMLSDRRDFAGGHFQTLEADGSMLVHDFDRGDAVVFVSHKPHCVAPVTAGQRCVLVMEVWEGDERECGHRCLKHFGHCHHNAWASFWRRALSDLATDL